MPFHAYWSDSESYGSTYLNATLFLGHRGRPLPHHMCRLVACLDKTFDYPVFVRCPNWNVEPAVSGLLSVDKRSRVIVPNRLFSVPRRYIGQYNTVLKKNEEGTTIDKKSW